LLLKQLRKTVQFLAEALEMLLALCSTLRPLSSPTKKGQVGLNLAIVGGFSTDTLRPIHRSGNVLSS
jgi:hypothetical protein